MQTRSKRVLATTAAVAIFATAGIGVMHAPFARSFMMRVGGCPMAGAHMTPALSAKALAMGLGTGRTTVSAPARPALGFALDATSLEQVHVWEKREHVDCDEVREGVLECKDVPARAVGEAIDADKIDELTLQFGEDGRLVNMTAWRSHLSPTAASTTALGIVSALRDTLGPTEKRAGQFDAAHLAQSPEFSVSTVAYRYSDYIAEVTAMNTPWSGPTVREHYMSVRD